MKNWRHEGSNRSSNNGEEVAVYFGTITMKPIVLPLILASKQGGSDVTNPKSNNSNRWPIRYFQPIFVPQTRTKYLISKAGCCIVPVQFATPRFVSNQAFCCMIYDLPLHRPCITLLAKQSSQNLLISLLLYGVGVGVVRFCLQLREDHIKRRQKSTHLHPSTLYG